MDGRTFEVVGSTNANIGSPDYAWNLAGRPCGPVAKVWACRPRRHARWALRSMNQRSTTIALHEIEKVGYHTMEAAAPATTRIPAGKTSYSTLHSFPASDRSDVTISLLRLSWPLGLQTWYSRTRLQCRSHTHGRTRWPLACRHWITDALQD